MEKSINTNNIKGWGSDADFSRRPYVPKHQLQENTGAHWVRPEIQKSSVEVLHSNERPTLSAVYGTTLPPQGVSGMVRRFAFKFSENSFGHWMPLILADRINFIEGLIDDIARGKTPRFFGDGYKVDLKHAPAEFTWRVTKKALVLSAPFVMLYFLLRNKDERKTA
jgi:hypothetical protein